jgi:glycosyltransferase involved in cell wall biosynthesis
MKTLGFDIVILALPRWDGLYSSTAYSLAQALSEHTRVFYIDNPFTWKDFLARRNSPQISKRKRALLRGKDRFTVPEKDRPNLIAVTPELVYPNNWMPEGFFYNMVSKWNDGIVNRTLKDLIKQYGVKDFVFINSFNPLFGRYFSGLQKPLLNIYHCVDDISKSVYISKHGTRLESEMIRKADLTLVTSRELMRLKQADSSHVYYLPNAANVDLFQQSFRMQFARPKELQSVPEGSKIIMYMGNICHRLDYDLLKKIARRFENYFLVMIGPTTNDNYKKAGLDKLPNVIFTGNKKLEELPAYLHFAACCIIPFQLIPLTRSIYPLKINEYLSAGKPVVTTNFSEDIATFANIAFVSQSHDDFVDNIETAILEDTDEKATERIAYAAQNNWNSRAIELVKILKSNIHQHAN